MAGLMMIIIVGLLRVGAASIDAARDSRAIRAGVDAAWILDDETGTPSSADIEALASTVIATAGIGDHEDFAVIATSFHRVTSGPHGQRWRGTVGTMPVVSRAAMSGTNLMIDGENFPLRAGERVIVLELFRAKRGTNWQRGEPGYLLGVAVKRAG